MKASLVVHRVTVSIEDNLGLILNSIDEASRRGSDLVMFSETTLTGLVNDDVPEHDVLLGTALSGTQVAWSVSERARRNPNRTRHTGGRDGFIMVAPSWRRVVHQKWSCL